jgi:hypothetical protein
MSAKNAPVGVRAPGPRAPHAPLAAFLRGNASPRMVFACGALLMATFLFQTNVVARLLEMALFFLLSALSGRRIRVVQNLLVFASIVAFNLFVPTGKVLLTVLGLSITEGALRSGLLKAAAMVGLIALSLFTLQMPLTLPGRLGGLLGRSLFYFQRIMSERARIDRKNIIGSIDALLLDVQGARDDGGTERAAGRTTARGAVLLAALAVVCGAALAVTRLG